MTESNSIIVTRDDQRAIVRVALRSSWLLIGAVCVVAGVVFGFLVAMLHGFIGHPLWVFATVVAIALLVFVLVVRSNARRVRASLPIGSTHAVGVTSDGLRIEGHSGTSQFEWIQLSDLRRFGGVVHFKASGTRLAIPGRLVTSEMLATMMSHIEAHAANQSATLQTAVNAGTDDEPYSRTITLTTDDVRAIRNGVWAQAAVLVGILGVFGIVLMAAAILDFVRGSGSYGWLVFAVGILSWGLCLGLLWLNARNVRSAWSIDARYGVRVTDDAIEFTEPAAASQTHWSQISHPKRRKHVVTMTINGVPQTIPGRLISPEMFATIEKRIAESRAQKPDTPGVDQS